MPLSILLWYLLSVSCVLVEEAGLTGDWKEPPTYASNTDNTSQLRLEFSALAKHGFGKQNHKDDMLVISS